MGVLAAVNLNVIQSPMLVVELDTGVSYNKEVGGGPVQIAREMVGFLVPFVPGFGADEALRKLPFDELNFGIDEGIADSIDGILRREPSMDFLCVDRTRLADSGMSWVWVIVQRSPEVGSGAGYGDEYSPSILRGLTGAHGVLTW